MIVGSTADTLSFSREAIENATEPTGLFVVEDATHIDRYDRPQYVSQAVAKVREFFEQFLG